MSNAYMGLHSTTKVQRWQETVEDTYEREERMETQARYEVVQTDADRRRDWLQERRTVIGGSDAAVVLGISPWKSRYELWAEKSGAETDYETSPHLDLGNNLEAVVLRLLAIKTGRHVEAAERFKLVRHPEYNWLACTPDGWERDWQRAEGTTDRGIVQAKTAFAMNKHDWDQEPPDYYRVQLQHEMLATGCTWGTLCVLFIDQGLLTRIVNECLWSKMPASWASADTALANAIADHADFRWFDYEADLEFQEHLLAAEQAFVNLIDTGTPPSTDGSDSCRRAIQRLHPRDNGTEIVLPEEWEIKAAGLELAKLAKKEAEASIATLENELKAWIGDATYARLPDGTRYSWKTQSRREYVVSATETRVLRKEKSK